MSTHPQKLAVLNETRTLADRIRALGIEVPDQRAARTMMEKIRLGFKHDAHQLWTIGAFWKRYDAWVNKVAWQPYAYDSFKAWADKGYSVNAFEKAYIPPRVICEADRIRETIPGASIKVHALQRDPWLIVWLAGETVIVRGWVGDTILL